MAWDNAAIRWELKYNSKGKIQFSQNNDTRPLELSDAQERNSLNIEQLLIIDGNWHAEIYIPRSLGKGIEEIFMNKEKRFFIRVTLDGFKKEVFLDEK